MNFIEMYVNNQKEEIESPAATKNAEENLAATTFLDLPPEVMTKILGELSLEDLKECKQVSLLWYHLIESIRPYLFESKAICVYDGHNERMSFLLTWYIWLQTICGKFHNIHGSEFCIRNIPHTSLEKDIIFWLKTKETQITHLELCDCYLTQGDYNSIFSELKHIESFSIIQSNKFQPYQDFTDLTLQDFEVKLNHFAKKNLKKLKKIRISKRRTIYSVRLFFTFHGGVSTFSQFLDLISKYCSNLETFEIIDTNVHFQYEPQDDDAFMNLVVTWCRNYLNKLFRQIGELLRVNSETIQNLTIGTFEIEDVRSSNCGVAPMNLAILDRRSVYDKPKLVNRLAFTYFMEIMMEQNWLDYNLELKTLNLSFQVANINPTPLLIDGLQVVNPKTFLLEFLTQQKQLQQINFGQLYLVSAQREVNMNFFDQLSKCLPGNCLANFEMLEDVANGMTTIEIQNFMHNFNSQVHQFGFVNTFNYLPIQFEPNDIINREDSTLKLRSNNLEWNFYYMNWPILTNTYLLRKLNTLTQIRIKQTNVSESKKLKIEDSDLQLIIQNGAHLAQLSIEWCNLKNVSDFGLTGVNKESCQRMKSSKAYEIQNGDLIGLPISSLSSLRVLRLGEVAENVSDVSAHFAFNGLKLRVFEILTPNFSPDGVRALKNKFKFNAVLKMNIQPLH